MSTKRLTCFYNKTMTRKPSYIGGISKKGVSSQENSEADETFDRNCCGRCQYFNTCIKNWIRGEHGLPRICCNQCKHYRSCLEKWTRQRGTPSTTRFIH